MTYYVNQVQVQVQAGGASQVRREGKRVSEESWYVKEVEDSRLNHRHSSEESDGWGEYGHWWREGREQGREHAPLRNTTVHYNNMETTITPVICC